MNKATEQMKQETQPLIVLIKAINSLLEDAEKCGVRIKLNCGGHLGPKESTEFVVIEKCVKDCLKKSVAFSLPKIENKLKQIEKKLKDLTENGYFVTLDEHNRRGYAVLYLENICMVLFEHEF